MYSELTRGNDLPLRLLLARDQDIEAGFQIGSVQTYRPYAPGEPLDLGPFLEWARAHPYAEAQTSTLAKQAGYGWVTARFPDDQRLHAFFAGPMLIKLIVSDRELLAGV